MMADKPQKPVGAPPAALTLHKTQTLDANERAHALKENAEHLLVELDEFMQDGRFTMAEFRHVRGHVALADLLAEEQCSILRWAWASLMQIEGLIAGYRLKLQAGPNGRLGAEIKVSKKKRAAGTALS
jgi:hypothetical protein